MNLEPVSAVSTKPFTLSQEIDRRRNGLGQVESAIDLRF
jgi:hypothetical protein